MRDLFLVTKTANIKHSYITSSGLYCVTENETESNIGNVVYTLLLVSDEGTFQKLTLAVDGATRFRRENVDRIAY